MCEVAAIDDELALDTITLGAKELQVIEGGGSAFGDGDNVVEHERFGRAAIRAAFAKAVRQLSIPLFMVCAQGLPRAAFDLRRRRSLVWLITLPRPCAASATG